MPNRINIDFKQEDYLKATKASTDAVILINTYAQEVRSDDRKGGQNMGDGTGWTFAQKAFNILTIDRTLVHVDLLDYDSFARNVDAAKKLLALKAIFGNWVGNMEGSYLLLGKDLMAQANYVLGALKPLADVKSAYKILYDDLNFLYENRATKAAATTEQRNRIAKLEEQVASFQTAAKNS